MAKVGEAELDAARGDEGAEPAAQLIQFLGDQLVGMIIEKPIEFGSERGVDLGDGFAAALTDGGTVGQCGTASCANWLSVNTAC